MKINRSLVMLFIFSLITFFWMLGSTTLWDYSEPEYAQVVKEIVRGHHVLTLFYNGEPYFTHPPLFYWLTAAVAKLFGFSEWAMRSVAAFFGALIPVLMFWIGKRWFGEKIAWLAGIVTLSMFHPFVMGRLVGIDSLLNFLLIISIFSFFEFYSTKKNIFLFLFYAGQVLAVLSKGPYGFFMPWAIGGLFLLSESWKFTKPQKKLSKKVVLVAKKLWEFLRPYQILWAIPLSLILGMSWYGYEIYVHGEKFIRPMFGEFLWGRVFGAVQGQKGPIYYYLPVIFLGLFPWFFMLPRALRVLWQNRAKPEFTYVFIILAFNLVFFSFTGTKLPNYLALCFPFAALLIAYVWLEFQKSKKRFTASQNLALFLLLLQTVLLGLLLYYALNQVYTQATLVLALGLQQLLMATVAISVLGVLLWLISKISLSLNFYVIAGVGLVFMFWLNTFFLPKAEALKTAPAMMRYLKSQMRPTEKLYVIDVASPSTVFYFDRKVYALPYDQIKSLLKNSNERVFVLFRENEFEQKYQNSLKVRYYHLKTLGTFTTISNRP